jgi:SMC interacting uncharacterized protein involved in chromosome segregation
MYLGIGFLVAALAGVIAAPLVHGRAVRLTLRRLEATTPASFKQMVAEKDQLRAEFSMSTRRLESTIENLKARSAGQATQGGKTESVFNRLKQAIGEKSAIIVALEAREKALRDQLLAAEEEIAIKTNAMHTAERERLESTSELAKMTSGYEKYSKLAEAQKLEITELKSQIETTKVRDELLLYVMGRHSVPNGRRSYDQYLFFESDKPIEN